MVTFVQTKNSAEQEVNKQIKSSKMFRFQRILSNIQAFSSRGIRNAAYRQERIVTNEDGSIIVCWHPEPKFPYELTQPVPRNVATAQT